MINDKRYYDAFKRISKGIENGGYVEWRRMIEKEFSDYEYSHKINVMKRCELNLGILQLGGSTTLGDYISKCIAIISIFVVAITALYASEHSVLLLYGTLIISSMLIIINVVCYLIDMALRTNHASGIMYYKEILEIIRGMLNKSTKKESENSDTENTSIVDSNTDRVLLQNNMDNICSKKIKKGQEKT